LGREDIVLDLRDPGDGRAKPAGELAAPSQSQGTEEEEQVQRQFAKELTEIVVRR